MFDSDHDEPENYEGPGVGIWCGVALYCSFAMIAGGLAYAITILLTGHN